MFWHRLRGHVKQRSAAFNASKIRSIATDDKWSQFLALLSRDSPLPFSLLTLFSVLCESLTVPPWKPWINHSSHRFFILWLEYDIYPSPDLATHPPSSRKEHIKLWMSLHLRLKQDFVKALNIFFSFHRSRIISWAPQNFVSAPLELLCFLLSILHSHPSSPSYPTLSSLRCPPLSIAPWIGDSDKLRQESQQSWYLSASQ